MLIEQIFEKFVRNKIFIVTFEIFYFLLDFFKIFKKKNLIFLVGF